MCGFQAFYLSSANQVRISIKQRFAYPDRVIVSYGYFYNYKKLLDALQHWIDLKLYNVFSLSSVKKTCERVPCLADFFLLCWKKCNSEFLILITIQNFWPFLNFPSFFHCRGRGIQNNFFEETWNISVSINQIYILLF